MECFKDCCRNLLRRSGKEQETQVIALKMPPTVAAGLPGEEPDGARRAATMTEDYLLSKLPPDGREVPFVLPTFKASYVQPRGSRFPRLPPGPQSSARVTYAERKAELLASGPLTYSQESNLHLRHMTHLVSPGSSRRNTLQARTSGPQSPASRGEGRSLRPAGAQRLCSSMFDLSSCPGSLQQLDSSVASSASSVVGSIESSLDSITLSGDERELGKVCVRLSYQEAVEQVWITLVQCSDISVCPDETEPLRIGFKGIITLPKPVQFKSSVKECGQDVSFMETFVFTLRLQQLRCSALVLRLQTHSPKKRTAAECVLSLRQLDSRETEHWLELSPPSKSSVCHAELHLTACFRPVNGRVQLQVLSAQNLPASCSPLSHVFFVKVEMQQAGQAALTRRTRSLKASAAQCHWKETLHFQLGALDQECSLLVKLYSRSSVRRKQCLGQVLLGFDSPAPEAAAQWRDAMAHPEKVVSAWHTLTAV